MVPRLARESRITLWRVLKDYTEEFAFVKSSILVLEGTKGSHLS